jgi:3-hydroxyacyl-[acyl-carrier-protein] dehydratase
LRFVLIDRLIALEPGRRALAVKTFGAGEEFLRDHFPGTPLVPGVLLTEAMGQTGGWLLVATTGFQRWPLLVGIERAKFRRPVRPGERVELEATVQSSQVVAWAVRGVASVEGAVVAESRLYFHAAAENPSAELLSWGRAVFDELGGPALLGTGEPR